MEDVGKTLCFCGRCEFLKENNHSFFFLNEINIFHKNTTSSHRLSNVFHENIWFYHASSNVFHKNIWFSSTFLFSNLSPIHLLDFYTAIHGTWPLDLIVGLTGPLYLTGPLDLILGLDLWTWLLQLNHRIRGLKPRLYIHPVETLTKKCCKIWETRPIPLEASCLNL